MTKSAITNEQAIEKVKELVKDIDTAMLTTITEGGLVSRPMKTKEIDPNGDLWFVTKKDTHKYQELLNNPQVNLAYAGKSYVSVSGKAEFVEDLEKKKEFWNMAYTLVLDASYDDPNVVLLRVRTESAEYWESGSRIKMALEFAKKITHIGNTETGHSNVNQTVDLKDLPDTQH